MDLLELILAGADVSSRLKDSNVFPHNGGSGDSLGQGAVECRGIAFNPWDPAGGIGKGNGYGYGADGARGGATGTGHGQTAGHGVRLVDLPTMAWGEHKKEVLWTF